MPSTRRTQPPLPASESGSALDQLYQALQDRLEATDNHGFEAYAADPVAFVETVLGQRPWAKQAEILRAVAAAPQTTVRSSHGVGKTWVAACSALWWVYSHRPSLVLTTAPTARQVEGVLWAEIHRLWHGAGQVHPPRGYPGLPLPGRCMLTRLAASSEQTALGLST